MGKKYLVKMNDGRAEQMEINGSDKLTWEDVQKLCISLGVDVRDFNSQELLDGANHEIEEHPSIIKNDKSKGLILALDHLKEHPDYYSQLKALFGGDDDVSIPYTQSRVNQMQYEAEE